MPKIELLNKQVFKLILWYTVVKTCPMRMHLTPPLTCFLFYQFNVANGIEVNITIDNYGNLTTNSGEKQTVNRPWEKSKRFLLFGNTKIVTIKGINDPNNVGGILASFNNGVLTDGTW